MAEEVKVGCSAARKPVAAPVEHITAPAEKKEEISMLKVGTLAPDFEAKAFFEGKFVNVKLSDYVGKWVLLCFYPGDFTFV